MVTSSHTPVKSIRWHRFNEVVRFVFIFILILMAVTQLFSFTELGSIFKSYYLPGGAHMATLVTALLPTFEVLALPYLLNMRLSVSMQQLSQVCGWAVGVVWILLGSWVLTTINAITSSGVFGSKPTTPAGFFPLIVGIVLLVLAAKVSYTNWVVRITVVKE